MIGFKTIEEFTLAECEAYLQRNDISEQDRQRAEKRKEELLRLISEQPQKSILEEFPEYGFKPTSLMPGPATINNKLKVLILLGVIVLLAGLVCSGLAVSYAVKEAKYEKMADYYLEKSCDYAKEGEAQLEKEAEQEAERMDDMTDRMADLEGIMGPIGGYVTFLGLCLFVTPLVFRKKLVPVQAVADYVSSSRKGKNKTMLIFVKDRRFGVLKEFNEVIVPAEYDKLTWQSKKYLFGEIDGKVLLVDTKGNRCTKPYDHLSWSEHKEVLRAELDGRSFLIDIYDNVLS